VRFSKLILLKTLFISALALLAVNACQRQLHFDTVPADATLEKDASGNCKPVIIGGAYTKSKNLSDTNYIIVAVDVNSSGSYSITSDTINGYYFTAKGNFSNTGSTTVKMLGHGKPTNTGNDQFTVRLNASLCSMVIPVSEGSAASFSFVGAPNRCTGAVVTGQYMKGVPLTSANTATVQVFVTTIGSFSFSSNFVNGCQFSASGYLSDYGNQTITLGGVGTPVDVGVNVFTLNAGFSACTIVDTVNAQPPPPIGSGNHLPLLHDNSWVYDDVQFSGDSVRRYLRDSTIFGSYVYRVCHEFNHAGGTDKLFRRYGNDYFDGGSVDRYTLVVKFSPLIQDDILFLSEGLTNNQTWFSTTYTGNTVSGQTQSLRYAFVCTNNNAIVSINGTAFSAVYQIQMRPQFAPVGGTFSDTGELYELYYANNIGLIYLKKTQNGTTQLEWKLRSWIVN
jgi:hypothetical protein